MFSHAMEKTISDGTYNHEDIGRRIVQEDEGVKT